mmetsp:Transcript_12586/g.23605  ORF Transcript_12586/g.23605 Transcript_12586/m.23605 type:complete len:133 (-) Transcript_12586:1063-1461(-)
MTRYEYGDPLLSAAGIKYETNVDDDKRNEMLHRDPCPPSPKADPLFDAAAQYHKQALHSEFHGHGDELMDAALTHWERMEQKEDCGSHGRHSEQILGKSKQVPPHQTVDHGAFQTQGDPMLGKLMEDLGSCT